MHKAIQNQELQAIMTVEKDIVDSIRQKESELLAKDKIIKQKDKELQQEKQRAEQLEQEKIIMIKELLAEGMPLEKVIKIANINTEFLKKYKLIS